MITERNNGNEYVAYPRDNAVTRTDDLSCFSSAYEAAEFCYENSTDLHKYNYMAIRSVYRTMSEAVHDKSLVVESKGLIDIETMVNARYQRLLPDSPNDNYKKNNTMNEKNLEYLSKQIKFTGFGEGHSEELKTKMEKQESEFTIFHKQDFGKDSIVATLQFNKSKEGDLYFFNRYSLMLKNDQHKDPIKQTFYINNDPKKKEQENITLKEGYNLLNGRAVNKDLVAKSGEKYNAWLQLDFKTTDKYDNYVINQYHQNYGYNLEKALEKHPIAELKNPEQKDALINSLKHGNLQAVTLELNGSSERVFIEANPQYKNLNIYDKDLKEITTELRNVNLSKNQNPEKIQDSLKENPNGMEGTVNNNEKEKSRGRTSNKNEAGADDLMPKNDKKKAKGKIKSGEKDELLPKKRVSNGKGIKI